MNIQDWFPLGLTCWISLQSKGLKSLLQYHSSKASIFQCSAFFMVQISHRYKTTGKVIALTRQTFVGKVMSLLFNTLSRFVIAFFSKEQVSINFMAALTICSDYGAPQNKVCHCFHYFAIYMPWSDGTRSHDLSFLNVAFLSQFFLLSSFAFIKRLFSSFSLSAITLTVWHRKRS